MKDPIINADGDKFWYDYSGLHFHREEIDPETGLSLPAGIWHTGFKVWYVNGKIHREDGPAMEGLMGEHDTAYYINGIIIPELTGKRIYGKEKLAKILVLI